MEHRVNWWLKYFLFLVANLIFLFFRSHYIEFWCHRRDLFLAIINDISNHSSFWLNWTVLTKHLFHFHWKTTHELNSIWDEIHTTHCSSFIISLVILKLKVFNNQSHEFPESVFVIGIILIVNMDMHTFV